MPKKWGQHFLILPQIIENTLKTAHVQATDSILEIGPGKGILTHAMLQEQARVTAIEIDPNLAHYLRQEFSQGQQFTLIEQDILKIASSELESLFPNKFKVVANLPYNIATAIFFKLLETRHTLTSITIMVQKEVAERICATVEQRKAYGVLAIAAELAFERHYAFTIPPEAFSPPPKVDSAVIHLLPKAPLFATAREQHFLKWIQCLFNQRRKTLMNNLRRCSPDSFETHKSLLEDQFSNQRVETLSLEQLLELFNLCYPPS